MKKSVTYIQYMARIMSPLIASLVTLLSLLPTSSLSEPLTLFPFSDKILHLIAYIFVSGTISIALAKVNQTATLKEFLLNNLGRILIEFVVVFSLGFCIEMVQPLFSRSRELLDLLFNSIGAIIGIISAIFFLYLLQRRVRSEKENV